MEELRKIIESTFPEVVEVISYGASCFKYQYILVGLGVNKKYCSLYVMSPGLIRKLQHDLTKVKVSGATIHFLTNEPLPSSLIEKIVIARKSEIMNAPN